MPESADVAIVGAGIIGGAVAYHLASAGARVVILEAREVASAASGASAGGVRQQGRDPRELPLALRAIARWPRLSGELGADLDYHQDGHITLAENDDELATLAVKVAAQRAAGLDIELIDGRAVRELAPGVGPTVVGGSYCASDGHAFPPSATRAFVAAALGAGADLWERTPVVGIARRAGRVTGVVTPRGTIACDRVVVAAGAWSAQVAALAGVDVPVTPVALQMIVTARMPALLKPVLGCVGRGLSLKQLANGRYLIGGGWPGRVELDQGRGATLASSIAGSACATSAIWPPLRQTPALRAWVGLEGLAADEVPIIAAMDDPAGLVLACGFSGHGFAIAPAVGEAVAGLILRGASPVEIGGLGLDRFGAGARA